jgi:hypothetical protein
MWRKILDWIHVKGWELVADSGENRKEYSCFIKSEKFSDHLKDINFPITILLNCTYAGIDRIFE